MDGTDDDCEKLGWKRLQEYNLEQRLWKYPSTLAERNAELDDNMPFEDKLGEDDYYPSLPFAALFSCFKAKLLVGDDEKLSGVTCHGILCALQLYWFMLYERALTVM
ncbi:hypothetical protein LOK49_LG11G01485 [Camellia lanceoleosa]|uniref:Uncharacterized protein n=1 Tax=Camellia lanceoleosa TaxID=1840588 RepID=A0ACC0G415_9ERIC|nr:hypothetical protein LOK49_LG11G01485 [Camellia lanceoleosa]